MAPGEIETYIYLLSCGLADNWNTCWSEDYEDQFTSHEDGPIFDPTFYPTRRNMDTGDYTGECTFFFEVVYKNISYMYTHKIMLQDENDVTVATIECPPNEQGSRGPGSKSTCCYPHDKLRTDLIVKRVQFTPSQGLHTYALRVQLITGWREEWYWACESIVKVTEAKIVIRQKNPTASVVHIPMMTDVNSAEMSWMHVDTGYHYVTDGAEQPCMEMYTCPYEADWQCQREYGEIDTIGKDDDLYSQTRNIWKYEERLLSPVSKVVFDAAVGYTPKDDDYYWQEFFGFPLLTWCWYHLRWGEYDYGNPPAYLTGGWYDDVVTDANGRPYHYIPNTWYEWNECDHPPPYTTTIELNPNDFVNAYNKMLYFCGGEDVYGACDNTYHFQWHSWGNFHTLNVSPGSHIVRIWYEINVFYQDNPPPDELHGPGNNVRITLRWQCDDPIEDGYVILWDKTAEKYVTGSELVWNQRTVYERKSVELPASALEDGHEYQMRWKQSMRLGSYTGGPGGGGFPDFSAYPRLGEANLWIYVRDMEEFTSWNRVSQQWNAQYVYSMWVYWDWWAGLPETYSEFFLQTIGQADYYWPPEQTYCSEIDPNCGTPGTLFINCRPELFAPPGSEVFYEASSLVWTYFKDCTDDYPNGNYCSGHLDEYYQSIYDVGTTTHGIPDPVGSEAEVSESRLLVTPAMGDGLVHRQRTGDIYPYVTSGNRYIHNSPLVDTFDAQFPLATYLITHYPQAEEHQEEEGECPPYIPGLEWHYEEVIPTPTPEGEGTGIEQSGQETTGDDEFTP